MAFLENNSQEDELPTATMPRQFCRSTTVDRAGGSMGWVCLLLAVLGFGGGLAIALLGFDSPESSTPVARVASELRYLPPGEAMAAGGPSVAGTAGVAEAESSVLASGIRSFGGLDGSFTQTTDASLSEASHFANMNPAFEGVAAFSIAQSMSSLDGRAIGGGYPASPGDAAASGGAGFDAVLAPVPEPSTWAMMVIGAALLVRALRRRVAR
jgi:hypothetical protein